MKLTAGERPTLLDYGCGKGAFLHEMNRSGRFRFARGYDPAVAAFKPRPAQLYDLIVCLDVLDQVEGEFVEPVIEDVAQFVGRFAVFDVITLQTPRLEHLNPRSAAVWTEIIARHLMIEQMIVRKATEKELQEGACPERTIFVTSRRAADRRPTATRAMSGPKENSAQIYSPAHLSRQREAHAAADRYGRHRHLYLHDMMRELSTILRRSNPTGDLSWLDYGCGKGGFIEEIRPLNLFTTIRGFDPAVVTFAGRPLRRFDLVTCLDVLDMVEPQFMSNVLDDVAALTTHTAVFDCLTRPKAGSRLHPHPPSYWSSLVGHHMKVVSTKTEYFGMDGFERVVIQATP